MNFLKNQRNGTIILFLFICVLQVLVFFKDDIFHEEEKNLSVTKKEIFFKEKTHKLPFKEKNKSKKNKIVKNSINVRKLNIDINSVNAKELQKIKGIGEIFSKRIIKYRNLLGGFVSKKQYSEIYGLKDIPLKNLIENTFINKKNIITLNIDKEEFKRILKHPYLDYEDVKTIFILKKEIKNMNEIIDSLNLEEYKKKYLKNYLTK